MTVGTTRWKLSQDELMDSEILKIADWVSELCVDKLCRQLRPENFFPLNWWRAGNFYKKSGWQDLNLRHLAPKASALAKLSYTPKKLRNEFYPM